MDVRDLESILAIVRAGAVPAAARALGVSHTTLYRRVDALETELGVRLFSRGTEGWRATPEGDALAREAEAIEVRLREVEARVSGRDGLAEGTVRLATGDHGAPTLAHSLTRFVARYPAIRVDVLVGARPARLGAGEAELLVWATPEPEPEAIGRRLMSVRYAAYVHRDLLDVPADRRPWVTLDPSVDPGLQARWEREHVPERQVRLCTSSRPLHLEAIRAGLGAGVLPHTVGGPAGLVRLGDWLPELERPLWLLVRRDVLHVARVRLLHTFLQEEARRVEAVG